MTATRTCLTILVFLMSFTVTATAHGSGGNKAAKKPAAAPVEKFFTEPMPLPKLSQMVSFREEGSPPNGSPFLDPALENAVRLECLSEDKPFNAHGWSKLKFLIVNSCHVRDLRGIERLTMLENLRFGPIFVVPGCLVEDDSPKFSVRETTFDVNPLRHLNNLRSLELYAVSVKDLKSLEGLINLRELRLLDVSVQEDLPFYPLQRLKTFTYSGKVIYSSTCVSICGSHQLDCIKIWDSSFMPPQVLSAIGNVSRLKKLEIDCLTLDNLQFIAGSSKLQHIKICGSQEKSGAITDLSPLLGINGLRSLQLDHQRIMRIDGIERLKNLRHLDLSGNPLVDLTPLACHPSIELLYINGGNVRDPRPILTLRRLTHIDMRNQKFDPVIQARVRSVLFARNVSGIPTP